MYSHKKKSSNKKKFTVLSKNIFFFCLQEKFEVRICYKIFMYFKFKFFIKSKTVKLSLVTKNTMHYSIYINLDDRNEMINLDIFIYAVTYILSFIKIM